MDKREKNIFDYAQRISLQKKEECISFVETETRRIFEKMPLLPIHDITHVERVVQNTLKICKGEGVDSFLPSIAAWLHDIGRLQEVRARKRGERVYHAEESAKKVPGILFCFKAELGGEGIRAIQSAVACHSSPNDDHESQLAVILKDADKLEGLGAVGLPRVFAFFSELPIYNSQTPFDYGETSEEHLRHSGKSTQIQALFRNMEWFADPRFWIRTETGVKLAAPRIKLMTEFLYQFADELGISRKEVDRVPVIQAVKKRLVILERDKRLPPVLNKQTAVKNLT